MISILKKILKGLFRYTQLRNQMTQSILTTNLSFLNFKFFPF